MNNTVPSPNKHMGHNTHQRGGARGRFNGPGQAEHQNNSQERAQRRALVRRLIAALENSDD